jgi:hypothetical protein
MIVHTTVQFAAFKIESYSASTTASGSHLGGAVALSLIPILLYLSRTQFLHEAFFTNVHCLCSIKSNKCGDFGLKVGQKLMNYAGISTVRR